MRWEFPFSSHRPQSAPLFTACHNFFRRENGLQGSLIYSATGKNKPNQLSPYSPKKRKLEELGFHHSPYYKIRAAVANLRGRFLQVWRATGSQKEDAAIEILKEIKVVMELSKKMRLDISAAAEHVKPFGIPAVRDVKNRPAEKVPSAGMKQVPTGEKVPLKPVSSQAAAVGIQREADTSEIANCTKQPGERVQGSYVIGIGGSPIGQNFLMWPGGKAVYYGLSKAEWLSLQAAK